MLRQLSLNSLWLLLSRVLTQGLYLVFIALVARNLGVEGFGQYTIFASIVYVGNVLTTYGVDVMLIREIARERRLTGLVSTALWVQLCLSLLWCLVFSIGSLPFLSVEWIGILFLYNLLLFPLAYYTIFSSILRAFERMDLYMGLNLCTALLQVLGVVVWIKTPDDLAVLGIWLFTVQSLTSLVAAYICKMTIPTFSLRMRLAFDDVLAVIRSGWRIALLAPLGLLSQRMNLFMLSWFSGDILTGWFSAAARLVEGLKLGHFAVTNSLMPSMSRPASSRMGMIHKFAFYGLLLWSVAAGFVVTFMADPITAIIYGLNYDPSAEVLGVIAWVLVPYTFSIYLSLTLIMRGAEAVVLNANLIGLIGSVVIYAMLIPPLGLYGAAWGTLVAETLQALVLLLMSRRLFLSANYAARST